MNKNNEKFGEPKRYGKSQHGVNNIEKFKAYTDALGIDINSLFSPKKKLLRTEKIVLENYKKFNGDIPRISKEMKRDEKFVGIFIRDLKKKGYIKDENKE